MALYDNLKDAVDHVTEKLGAGFTGLSYIGSFPGYYNREKGTQYTIQGGVEFGSRLVVCSINKKEMELLGYCA